MTNRINTRTDSKSVQQIFEYFYRILQNKNVQFNELVIVKENKAWLTIWQWFVFYLKLLQLVNIVGLDAY